MPHRRHYTDLKDQIANAFDPTHPVEPQPKETPDSAPMFTSSAKESPILQTVEGVRDTFNALPYSSSIYNGVQGITDSFDLFKDPNASGEKNSPFVKYLSENNDTQANRAIDTDINRSNKAVREGVNFIFNAGKVASFAASPAAPLAANNLGGLITTGKAIAEDVQDGTVDHTTGVIKNVGINAAKLAPDSIKHTSRMGASVLQDSADFIGDAADKLSSFGVPLSAFSYPIDAVGKTIHTAGEVVNIPNKLVEGAYGLMDEKGEPQPSAPSPLKRPISQQTPKGP